MLEKTFESSLDSKENKPVNSKGNKPWICIGRTNAEASIFWSPDAKSWLWKKPWCWEGLRTGGDRGWDAWMASLTQWTWVWANSERQWRTGKPGVLQSMESQRDRHYLATEHHRNWWTYTRSFLKHPSFLLGQFPCMVFINTKVNKARVQPRSSNTI